MTHAEFVAAWREGRLRVEVDRKAAAHTVSARLMLRFVLLPVMGVGVALALVGRYFATSPARRCSSPRPASLNRGQTPISGKLGSDPDFQYLMEQP